MDTLFSKLNQLSADVQELHRLKLDGANNSQRLKIAMRAMTALSVIGGVGAMIAIAVLPGILGPTLLASVLFGISSTKTDDFVNFSPANRARHDKLEEALQSVYLKDLLDIKKLIEQKKLLTSPTDRSFLNFTNRFISHKLSLIFEPSKMGPIEKKIKSLFPTEWPSVIESQKQEFLNNSKAMYEAMPFFANNGISAMDMLASDFIKTTDVYNFLSNGYVFSQEDYLILSKLEKEELLPRDFIAQLEHHAHNLEAFNKYSKFFNDTAHAITSNSFVKLLTDTVVNTPVVKELIEAHKGTFDTIVSQTKTKKNKLNKSLDSTQGSYIKNLFKGTPELLKQYEDLIANLEISKSLPLSPLDKLEIGNIEKKVLPEVLEIYSFSKKLKNNSQVKEYLVMSMSNIDSAILAVIARSSEDITNQADALSRYTHTKSMSMGGKN